MPNYVYLPLQPHGDWSVAKKPPVEFMSADNEMARRITEGTYGKGGRLFKEISSPEAVVPTVAYHTCVRRVRRRDEMVDE